MPVTFSIKSLDKLQRPGKDLHSVTLWDALVRVLSSLLSTKVWVFQAELCSPSSQCGTQRRSSSSISVTHLDFYNWPRTFCITPEWYSIDQGKMKIWSKETNTKCHWNVDRMKVIPRENIIGPPMFGPNTVWGNMYSTQCDVDVILYLFHMPIMILNYPKLETNVESICVLTSNSRH